MKFKKKATGTYKTSEQVYEMEKNENRFLHGLSNFRMKKK
jgi:hypothetical protein